MNPDTPSRMSCSVSRTVSSRSTVLVASQWSAPGFAGVGGIAYMPRRSCALSIAHLLLQNGPAPDPVRFYGAGRPGWPGSTVSSRTIWSKLLFAQRVIASVPPGLTPPGAASGIAVEGLVAAVRLVGFVAQQAEQ